MNKNRNLIAKVAQKQRHSWVPIRKMLSSSISRLALRVNASSSFLSRYNSVLMKCNFSSSNSDVLTGTCKWFDAKKGFGFVVPEDGSGDVFVHQTAIHAVGFRSLAVSYLFISFSNRQTSALLSHIHASFKCLYRHLILF